MHSIPDLVLVAVLCSLSKRVFSMNLGFLLTVSLLFHLLPHLSAARVYESDSKSMSCPDHFECGNLGRMTFPFANFSQPYCGLCMVDCHSQPLPTIKLNPSSGQLFQARSRSQTNNIINLHDDTFESLLQNLSCHLFRYSIYLPNSPSISFTIKSNITLFRCSKSPQHIPVVVDYFKTSHYKKNDSCPDFDLYYRNQKHYNYSLEREFPPPGCSRVHFPIRKNASEDTRELLQLLTADFDLEWHLSDKCHHCHHKGGQCETDDMNEFRCAKTQEGKYELIILVTAAQFGIMLLVLLVYYLKRKFPLMWRSKTLEDQQLDIFLKNYGSLAPKRYQYSDVKKMTNSFETKLGQGGYGSVYKGKLQDGSLVAVKVLKESKGNGEEFINEVASISRTSHVNIVTLLGFCFQGDKKALIYEFMANGSLEKFIYGEKSSVNRQLDWSTLYKITVGIARGLEYLHRGCSTRILHFDIKPHNILLDKDFCPKISDFGLAKLCTRKDSIISTMAARGTIGYIAPEIVCKNFGGVSHKSDVYSYGMMVLEMVGGRKNVDAGVDHTSEIYFPHWIYARLDQDKELCLSEIMNEEEDKQASKMLMVSLWCIQTNPTSRPTISNVLKMLEGTLEALKMPPSPFLDSSSRS